MWLQIRLYLLFALMFAIVYAILVIAASAMGLGFSSYVFLAIAMLFFQYMLGPKMVELTMGVRYISEKEYPELHKLVEELAGFAGMKKPRVGISRIPIPNAFAFGRWGDSGRICVTESILKLLNRDELKAVLGHEMSHLKHRDVAVITALSIVPTICWYIYWSTMFAGGRGRDNRAALGITAFLMYFITNLLVLYGSRIREYYADEGSVKLRNAPHHLASALYKLVYGSARMPAETLKQAEGYKAFFANDPSRARYEIRELKEIDTNFSGTIDQNELLALRSKRVRIGTGDKLMEMLSTHPNMVERIKRLSELTA